MPFVVQRHVCATKKAPEDVVTDGYEGAIYVQCGKEILNFLLLAAAALAVILEVVGVVLESSERVSNDILV